MLKTPGCQSPGLVRYSPRSRSPDRIGGGGGGGGGVPSLPAPAPSFPGTKHIHHHYVHLHHAGPRTKEQAKAEAAQRALSLCPPVSADFAPV